MIPKEGIVPPGGFHFIDRSSGTDHRVDGSSFRDVAERVLRYRITNKLPVGRPLEEVHAFVCDQWPHFCHVPSAPVGSRITAEPSYTIAVLQNINLLWQKQAAQPRPLVGDGEAQRRAQACQQCPHQRDWADYGCGSCVEGIRQRSFVFRAGRDIGAKLTGCALIKQDNTSAIFAEKSLLPDVPVEAREKLPHFCWRKNP